jgi:hypothetical protein
MGWTKALQLSQCNMRLPSPVVLVGEGKNGYQSETIRPHFLDGKRMRYHYRGTKPFIIITAERFFFDILQSRRLKGTMP